MNISSLERGREELQSQEELFFSHQIDVFKCADLLIETIRNFPDLTADNSSSKIFCRLIGGIYSKKGDLPFDRQKQITELFWSAHNVQSIKVFDGPEDQNPVQNIFEEGDTVNALLEKEQDYPIPTHLFQNEQIPTSTYLKPLLIELGDGSTVTISLGLLGYFSDMVKTLIKRVEMQEVKKLVLEQMDRHQFDAMIAFLLTKEATLINDENIIPLIFAAGFLQIPDLLEGAIRHVLTNFDDVSMFHILNLLTWQDHKSAIHRLEKRVSEIIAAGLQKPVSPEFLQKLESLKNIVTRPMCIDLSGTEITDDMLLYLIGLPVRELQLLNCQKLTKKCFDNINQIPSIRTLKVGGCLWVDDEALSCVPSSLEELSLSVCPHFTKKGLANLQNSNVRILDLFGCKHLEDADFAALPDQFEVLSLNMCKGVGKNAMKRFGEMAVLENLCVASTSIDDEGVSFLSHHLTSLDISKNKVTSACLNTIQEMRGLRNLSLSGMKIKDDELELLPQSLVHLRLDRCTLLTNAGIIPLANRKPLKYLGLWECSKITSKAIAMFDPAEVTVGWKGLQPAHFAKLKP